MHWAESMKSSCIDLGATSTCIGMQRFSPRRSATATRTTSSSRRRPMEAISKTASQSPLCWLEAAKNDAFCLASTKPDSTTFLSSRRPGLSHDDCLWNSSFKGGTPKEEDQRDKYISKMVSGGRCVVHKIDYWRGRVLTTEAKNAGGASEVEVKLKTHLFHSSFPPQSVFT